MGARSQPIAAALRESRDGPDAFARFYAEHGDRLIAYFLRRVYEPETALDLAAETMARAYLSRKRFRGTTDAEAAGWLYRIAERLLASYFRTHEVEARALSRMGLERPHLADDADAELLRREALSELQQAIGSSRKRLSTEQANAIELRFDEELSYPQIAERLSISEPAARARVARALKTLSQTLTQTATPLEGVR